MTITKLQSVDPRVRRCPSASGPLSAAVAATLGLLPAVAAYAQDDAAGILEEVVVRAPHYVPSSNSAATKLDIPLIETPQAITVIPRDQIDLLNWDDMEQAVRYTSGVVGENFGPDERYDWLTLRGFNPIQYVDGLQAPVGSVTNVGLDLYGFQSMEVLKGPASVLYGQTPPGGIVNLTSRRPERDAGGEFDVQYGSFDHKQVAGDMTGPIGDISSYRLTALYRDRETQMDFVESERLYVAPAFTFDFSTRTRLTLLGYFQQDDIKNDGGGFLPAQGVSLPNPFGEVPIGRNLGEPGYNRYERDHYGVGYDFVHEFSDAVTLRQNLKYSNAEVEMHSVYGGGLQEDLRTVNRNVFDFNEDVDSLAVDTRAELRFGDDVTHTVLAGVDYRDYENVSEFTFGFWAAPTLDLFEPVYGVGTIPSLPYFPFTNQQQEQIGAYLQDQIRFDRLIFTLSARNDWVDTENPGQSKSDSEFTYRAGVNYLFDSGLAPYAAYATSFQPTPGATFEGDPFDPTSGEQFEVGIKYEPKGMPDGVNAFMTLAAYELTQEDVLTPDPDPDHLFFNVQAGEVEVKGIELEGVARFNERLSLNGSYSYTDSEVTKSNGPDLGKRLTMVPEQKFSLLVDYTFQTGALAGFGFGAGVRYQSDSYGDGANEWRNPSVTLYDAILHYDRAGWRFAVNGSNLTDKEYVSRCSSIVDCFYGLRRVVTASVTRHWGAN